jgi:hypothetical protein
MGMGKMVDNPCTILQRREKQTITFLLTAKTENTATTLERLILPL